jgi:hypothetical protein
MAMPSIQIEKPRSLCPAGPQVIRLVEVTEKETPNFNDPNVMDTRLLWRFVVKGEVDEDGLQYEVAIFTGLKYGNPKAKLTWLLDMLDPGMTKKKAEGLDPSRYIDTDYETLIKHVPGQRDPSKRFAEPQYLKPMVNKASEHGKVIDAEGNEVPDLFEDA